MERNVNIKIDIDDRAPTSYNDLIKIGDSINLTIDLLSKGESVDLRDSSVELFLKKEDGTKVEQEVIIGDSKVSCTPLNIQSTTAVGQVCGELVVESSGKQVTSSTFIFNVEGSTSSEILEESKDDIATIKSLKNTIVNVNSVVEKYKTNIEAIAGTSESIEALAQIKIYAESAVTEIETVVNTGNTLKTSLEFENTRAENNIQELNNLGSESIKTHINNTDIHVAASDKTKWDSYEQLISDNTSHLNEKANLSDVKIFTSLADIGLTINDMTTDFGANILKMIKAMGRNRKLVLYPYSAETNTNLYNSVKTWCGLDTDAYTIVIESSFNGADNLPNKIEVYPNTNTGNNRYFVGFYDNAMGKCREVATTEIFNFESLLVNGWHVGNCSFRGKKIGNEMLIEGIIVNNLESPNKIIAQGLPIPSDGKWHGGSSMCSDNSSIYLVLQPNGDLLFQQNGQKKDLLYTIIINYPV
ncbi:BppU family phage baseplate upper protein [Clostridium butyricum]|uniref:BppU family phage baseplate upper protein n=1 Tax=Clostridium butyricum TaxID=1492 RepID=UPI00374E5A0E